MFKRTNESTRGFFLYVTFRGRLYTLGNREAALAAAREDGVI